MALSLWNMDSVVWIKGPRKRGVPCVACRQRIDHMALGVPGVSSGAPFLDGVWRLGTDFGELTGKDSR